MLAVASLGTAIGCGANAAPADMVGAYTAVPLDDGVAGPPSTSTPQPTLGPARVCGALVDVDQRALAGGRAQICDSTRCFGATSAGDGSFCVDVPEAGPFRLHSLGFEHAGAHYGELIFPMPITAADVAGRVRHDVGALVVPRMSESRVLDPPAGGTLGFSDGTTLTFNPGVLTPPSSNAQPLDVSVARVARGQIPPRLLASHERGSKAAFAYVLMPTTTRLAFPAGFAVDSSLPPGTQVDLLWANDRTGVLETQLLALVGSGGRIESARGEGLLGFGWIVVATRN